MNPGKPLGRFAPGCKFSSITVPAGIFRACLCALLLVALDLSVTCANAGEIRDFFETLGGCQATSGPLNMLEDAYLTRQVGASYLGKRADDWTDDNIAEFRAIYAECLVRWPISVLGSIRAGEPIVAPAAAVKKRVDERVAEIMRDFIGPARAQRQQEQAAEEARKRMEQTAIREAARIDRQAAERARDLANEKLARDREQQKTLRDGFARQAKADLEAAESAKRLAEEEAPLIASTEKAASEARKARLEAESRLSDLEHSLDRAKQARAIDDARLRSAEKKRLLQERQKREKAEDDALPKSCSISFAQFNRLTLGMRLRDVRQTFGCTGVLTSSNQIASSTITAYRWDAVSGFSYTVFENDILISKSQDALD